MIIQWVITVRNHVKDKFLIFGFIGVILEKRPNLTHFVVLRILTLYEAIDQVEGGIFEVKWYRRTQVPQIYWLSGDR